MNTLIVLGPLLISIGALATLIQFEERYPRVVRALCAALCVFLAARYVWWRFEYSIPQHQNVYQQAWAWFFFAFEGLSIISATSVLFFMSRRETQRSTANTPPELADAPVDVFIATYNESMQVLERTIVGAKAINHKDLRVWVLDDGARDWVRDLADELGALYVR
ncbi:MAG TPA: glycosyltransferase, partial [Roseiarcus sp.]|nr:glycosyltransferase [Roseiarcus sp.]